MFELFGYLVMFCIWFFVFGVFLKVCIDWMLMVVVRKCNRLYWWLFILRIVMLLGLSLLKIFVLVCVIFLMDLKNFR